MDPSFDFNNAYKQHYCTLFNIFISEIRIEISYVVDGVSKKLTNPEGNLFSIQYREWQNANQFELEPQNYFSTKELAHKYFNENLEKFGLEALSREKAIEAAKLNL